jgi:hypothetical protein
VQSCISALLRDKTLNDGDKAELMTLSAAAPHQKYAALLNWSTSGERRLAAFDRFVTPNAAADADPSPAPAASAAKKPRVGIFLRSQTAAPAADDDGDDDEVLDLDQDRAAVEDESSSTALVRRAMAALAKKAVATALRVADLAQAGCASSSA